MKSFELERLKKEGKDVLLPGGKRAIDMVQARMFEEADERVDSYFGRQDLDDLQELEDAHGLMPAMLLGC